MINKDYDLIVVLGSLKQELDYYKGTVKSNIIYNIISFIISYWNYKPIIQMSKIGIRIWILFKTGWSELLFHK